MSREKFKKVQKNFSCYPPRLDLPPGIRAACSPLEDRGENKASPQSIPLLSVPSAHSSPVPGELPVRLDIPSPDTSL